MDDSRISTASDDAVALQADFMEGNEPGQGRRAEAPPQLDLVHLSRQTMGDRDLETELLGLFARQARSIMQSLTAPAQGGGSPQQAGALLHTLCGSARAVGSWSVAAQADRLESGLRTGSADAAALRPAALDGLGASVERVCAEIDHLLGGRD